MNFFDNVFSDSKLVLNGNISGLTSELKIIYTYNLYKKYNKNILFVSNTLYEANTYFQSLVNYTNNSLLFPMDDFLTSEALAISPELKTTRLETLNTIVENNTNIIITNLMGFLRFLPNKLTYKDSIIILKKLDTIDISKLSEKLTICGYTRTSIVNKTGEFAVRGYIIDIFPINSSSAIRIEFWGDEIDSIRKFNVDTQLTTEIIDEVVITPNSETLFDGPHRDMPKHLDAVNIGGYLDDYILIFDNYEVLKNSYADILSETIEYSKSINLDASTKYMFSLEENTSQNTLYYYDFDASSFDKNNLTFNSNNIENLLENNINKILNKYIEFDKTIIICLENRYQVNKLIEKYENKNFVFTNESKIIFNKINLIVKKINRGFLFNNFAVISSNEVFKKKSSDVKYKTNFKIGTKIRDITKLEIGDYVVHGVHGIGKYLGLKTLSKNGLTKDYLMIEYSGGDKLYVPVEKIDWISKYASSTGSIPRLTKLGGSDFEKTKSRIKKKIESIALDLLKLYAKRESTPGISFDKDTIEQELFENDFAYEETTDQTKVIYEIKKDMESPHPMDRLLCGDVGYGKTEVAFRAMFKAVSSGRQVAMLCPTTLLSRQHYENAIKRFEGFPINIGVLNRFVTQKKRHEVLQGLADGTIDIVIGTHMLLNDDIKYKNLGLLVVDEEQRFGVKHKEQIKKKKSTIDVLTLSATPIPRTLQMSMAGLRSLSLIETPPVNRYPIQTYVLSQNNQVIKDAVYKELSRGGQVYVLYNNVENMDLKKQELNKLLPDVSIGIAHGKMNKNQIESVMNAFYDNKYQVLLCTTIIETGIDIPNVNTIIIIDADKFGLSQLYQIRGRVGRSNKIAYCYLMYQPGKILSDVATKRLQAIKDFTELGSGFALAMRDLSIRGAGDILGSEQAGFVDTVGVELFMSMLTEEISRLKGDTPQKKDESNQPLVEVSTSIDSKITDDDDLRIEIHKKINTIDSVEMLNKLKDELSDRFGKLDDNLIIYMYEQWFENLARSIGINKIKQTKNSIEIILPQDLTLKLRGDILFKEVTKISRKFRFGMKNKCLIITLDIVSLDKHFIYYLVDLINVIKKSING